MSKPKICYLSTFAKHLGKHYKPLYGDVYFEPNFFRLWRFIHKYGSIRKLCPITQSKIEPFNHGKCIGTAIAFHNHYEANRYLYQNYLSSYAEGITNYGALSLHAWNNVYNSRHEYAVEFTRDINKKMLEHALYAGVEFDIEFVRWLYKVQTKNPVDKLPYLSNYGRSCLTYRPLLDGKLKDYPISNIDDEEVMLSLTSFIESWPR